MIVIFFCQKISKCFYADYVVGIAISFIVNLLIMGYQYSVYNITWQNGLYEKEICLCQIKTISLIRKKVY